MLAPSVFTWAMFTWQQPESGIFAFKLDIEGYNKGKVITILLKNLICSMYTGFVLWRADKIDGPLNTKQ